MRRLPYALLLLAALVRTAAAEEPKGPTPVNLTVVNIEYEGKKVWVPGTIIAPKGAKVTLKLINDVPSDPAEHGYAIPAYNIAAIVKRGEAETVEFTAATAGVFPIFCQLHPAHLGGQLVVLP